MRSTRNIFFVEGAFNTAAAGSDERVEFKMFSQLSAEVFFFSNSYHERRAIVEYHNRLVIPQVQPFVYKFIQFNNLMIV